MRWRCRSRIAGKESSAGDGRHSAFVSHTDLACLRSHIKSLTGRVATISVQELATHREKAAYMNAIQVRLHFRYATAGGQRFHKGHKRCCNDCIAAADKHKYEVWPPEPPCQCTQMSEGEPKMLLLSQGRDGITCDVPEGAVCECQYASGGCMSMMNIVAWSELA